MKSIYERDGPAMKAKAKHKGHTPSNPTGRHLGRAMEWLKARGDMGITG